MRVLRIIYITEKGKATINEQIAKTKEDMARNRRNQKKGEMMFNFFDGEIHFKDLRTKDEKAKEVLTLMRAIEDQYKKDNDCLLNVDYKIEWVDC
jgi:hypothetical protein